MLFEDCQQVVAVCSRIEEGMFSSFCVEKAAHRIELSEVECENFHSCFVLWFWGWNFVSDCSRGNHHHGFESPDFIPTAPSPNPGHTWILSPRNLVPP